MSFFEFPHARTYDSDLGWIIAQMKDNIDAIKWLQRYAESHQPEYEELKEKVDALVNNLVDVIEPWDSSVEYPIYSIVSYLGQNYIAIRPVPVGAMITNEYYWQPANTVFQQINAIGVTVSDLQDDMEELEPRQYYVTPENYGAAGDGETDDTAAIQAAVNSGQRYVMFYAGRTYRITATIYLPADVTLDLNGATIESTVRHAFFNFTPDSTATGYGGNGNITIKRGTIRGGSISIMHGRNLLFENLRILDSLNDHLIEICACSNVHIRNCYLSGMNEELAGRYEFINIDPCYRTNFPWLDDESSPSYDGTINDGVTVEGCQFIASTTTGFGSNNRGFGCHSTGEVEHNYHKNIIVRGCVFEGMAAVALSLNDMEQPVVEGCEIYYAARGIIVGNIAETKSAVIRNNLIVKRTSGFTPGVEFGASDGAIMEGNVFGSLLLAYLPSNALAATADTVQTFKHCQEIPLTFGGNVQACTGLLYGSPAMNELVLTVGRIGSGTWQRVRIRAFSTRGFTAGEQFPVLLFNGTDYARYTITITADGFTSDIPAALALQAVNGAYTV